MYLVSARARVSVVTRDDMMSLTGSVKLVFLEDVS